MNDDHIIHGLVGGFHLPIDVGSIATCRFINDLMVKADLNEVIISGKLNPFVKMGYVERVAMVTGDLDKSFETANLATKPSSRDYGLVARLAISTNMLHERDVPRFDAQAMLGLIC